MCGICGTYGIGDKKLVGDMCKLMAHRGPDDSGIYADDEVILGHRRLSIIDLKGGHQPLGNEDGSIWLVFNGEIYNFMELRGLLEKKGHRFSSKTDSEVIIHLYEEKGLSFASMLDGMFAFALWDSGKKRLVLVRDRMGKKQLYYSLMDSKLVFSSELKSILLYKEVKREIDYHALDLFLSLRVIPDPHTIIKNVRKLPPGNILVMEKGKVEQKEYWKFDLAEDYKKSEKDWIREMEVAVKNAVEKRLVSDVPIGAFLSGGLDSSIVVALMTKLCKEKVKTFTVGFGEPGDEYVYAREVAEYYGTDHNEILMNYKSMTEILPRTIWHMDEPTAEFAIIPTYFVSELAKKKIKVALLGEGCDEMFGGYQRYNGLSSIYERMPYYFQNDFSKSGFNLAEKLVPEKAKERLFIKRSCVFSENEKKGLYSEKFLGSTQDSGAHRKIFDKLFKEYSFPNSGLMFDTTILLPNFQLQRVDRMTMAHGIEARAPFLDLNVVKMASSMPHELKLSGITGKAIIRKTFSKILPKSVAECRKRPFFIPMNKWFVNELYPLAQNILDEAHTERRGYFKIKQIKKIYEIQKNVGKNIRYSTQIGMLVNLEIWHQLFIDNDDLMRPKLELKDIR